MLIILSHTVLIHLLPVNIWVKEDPVAMIVIVHTEIVDVDLALLVVEDIIVQEVVADHGLAK